MECKRVSKTTCFPGYLDGALPSRSWSETHQMIGHHLELCGDCREERCRPIEAMSSMMSQVQHPAPPADLALRDSRRCRS